MMRRPSRSRLIGSVGLTFVAGIAACAKPDGAPASAGDGGRLGDDDAGESQDFGDASSLPSLGDASAGGDTLTRPCDQCEDFPASPIIDAQPEDGAQPPPSDAVSRFGSGGGSASGGPCLVEPQIGTLFPQNWLRPRFRFASSLTHPLFELRLHADRQKNDLVVYTTSRLWRLPKKVWDLLRASTWDEPITVTVRSVDLDKASFSPSEGSKGTISIAPVRAEGSMVYWAAVGEYDGQSWLEGFRVGDESVVTALDVATVASRASRDQGGQLQASTGAVQCIGCHTTVPDGKSVAFIDTWPWGGALASVEQTANGAVPSFVTPGGAEAFAQPWLGIMTFSKASWQKGERIVITSYARASGKPWDGQTWSDSPKARLAWFDLATDAKQIGGTNGSQLADGMLANEGKSYGFLARNGDPRGAASPDWRHDGTAIVYVSTDAAKDGRMATGIADLYTVPYNAKAGGNATPLPGASESAWSEYYPAHSPDDRYVAFTRAPSGQSTYSNPNAEVFVVPSAGGSATRLLANDPAACAGTTSPGIMNSWAKWSPQAKTYQKRTFYWLVFSSSRDGLSFAPSNVKGGGTRKASQLYVTALVEEGGKLTTYPALYLWNQPSTYGGSKAFKGATQGNLTPSWDVVEIPPVPPPR